MLCRIQNDARNKLDISGTWDFEIDPNEEGAAKEWFSGLTEARPMAVLGSWNEQYADPFNYLGPSWYVKRTSIPQSWQAQRVFIRVGSANYRGTI